MNTEAVRVWDLPVRLFHWLIVVLLAVSWWSAEQGGVMLKYHMWSGFTVLTLVLFRVAWGFVGSRYARFTDFVHGPRRVFGTLGALFDRRPLAIAGHNPLGGWMVVALLVCLLVQTMTGLFANDDLFNEGPLYSHVSKALSDRLTAIHHVNFSVMVALVGIHVLAVVWHRLRKGEQLVSAMITGRKTLPQGVAVPAEPVGVWRVLVLIAASAAIVGVLINL